MDYHGDFARRFDRVFFALYCIQRSILYTVPLSAIGTLLVCYRYAIGALYVS